jgi:alanine racemase
MAGYADGLRRLLSNRGVALIRGHRVPFVGRVAMDMLMVDVTNVPGVALEDEVTLIGEQAGASIWADEVAELSETITYEVLASLSARIVRVYTRNGLMVSMEDLAGYREAPFSDLDDPGQRV